MPIRTPNTTSNGIAIVGNVRSKPDWPGSKFNCAPHPTINPISKYINVVKNFGGFVSCFFYNHIYSASVCGQSSKNESFFVQTLANHCSHPIWRPTVGFSTIIHLKCLINFSINHSFNWVSKKSNSFMT